MEERYYKNLAVAAVRGRLSRLGKSDLLNGDLMTKPLYETDSADLKAAIAAAKETDMKIYPFKKSERVMPRVHKTLGFLRGIYFENLLDVGSGRGAFLFPFMEAFPHVCVTSLEILRKRIDLLSDISRGGETRLSVLPIDICEAGRDEIPDSSFDVVTLLEVLEHIPRVRDAIRNAVRIAKSYIIVTVPSCEDDNPEHIHLLTKETLTAYFNECGVRKLSFDEVPSHLFMIARLDG